MSSTAPCPARTRPAPAWARLLLCAALLLGVGAMHTLGHDQPGGHDGGHAVTAAVSTADHPVGDPPDIDPVTVCLAIVALGVALVGVAPAAFFPWPGTPSPTARVPRGPSRSRAFLPPAPSLALLQVLRV
ncbi:hypothetical protein [Nocardiopsis sp. YSL2]|uniref:hypothetical protein n=1 Tax=Nocardiopsis sp. YSL2 TaxID=2939492 RepID=UPI0026F46648|nr:hypothetical protein [Nocardiopsis sp. YSL2]